MIGVFDHDRNRAMIEEPSRSGKPRSRIIRSGGFSVAERMPSSASCASCTVNPSNSKAARRNCRIWSSSSMTSMVALPIVDHRKIPGSGFLRLQTNGHECTAVGALAGGFNLTTIRSHEGFRDPQAKTRSGHVRCVSFPTKEPFPKKRPFLSNETDALVLDRQHNRVTVAFRGNGDRRAWMRVLRRMVDDLPECLFKQNGVTVDDGQFVRNIQQDAVTAQEPLPTIDRRIYDVSRLDPLAVQPNALAGDQGSIEQVLHVIVEPIDLVTQEIGERRESRVSAIARRAADHRCRAEDRDQWRA